MSIEIIGLRFTHRKSINPSLYGPFFNYFGGGILRYYLHAVYGMMNCIVIERYPDRWVYRNPGTMLVSVEQYFKGDTTICRNSTLQKIFSFVGGNERAGSGADMIVKA